MDINEKKRRNKIFIWAIIVIVVNLLQYFIHNSVTIGIASLVTVYALYVVTIKDRVEQNKNKKK
ncbi:hypothetical protein RD055328_12000 [Companilactobacillus sp. RD055328]|uniref:hypothetical protein n=1 Tax=Companilactobacillus sp. RD055328 TaxID=2916634 RepID=UPI001FC8E62F|nr:hypothetical protein [Companilactobacillus sp. RD055328]GKQ43277.1 hypothetical protein RD055328_12000 [Companilactobacillus sp. RD055328]